MKPSTKFLWPLSSLVLAVMRSPDNPDLMHPLLDVGEHIHPSTSS